MAAPDRKRDYVKISLQYANAVISGKIPAGKYVRQACQRQVNDLRRFKGKASAYRFNPVLTDAVQKPYVVYARVSSAPANTLGATARSISPTCARA